MRTKNTLLTAVVIGVAVAAGLLGAGGTWALWNAHVTSNAGTVQAADFRVELNGSPMTVDGTAATMALDEPTTPLTPTTPVYATVIVKNVTDAGGPFSIAATLGEPTVKSPSVPALAHHLTVDSALAPPSGTCSAGTYSGPRVSATIAQGASARFCLRMSLPEDAPETLRDATATITVPVTATQIETGA